MVFLNYQCIECCKYSMLCKVSVHYHFFSFLPMVLKTNFSRKMTPNTLPYIKIINYSFYIPWERPRLKLIRKIVCFSEFYPNSILFKLPTSIYICENRERSWFELSVSRLRVWLSADGAKNFSWPWLSPLQGWGTLTMEFTSKFVYIAHHFTCYGSISLIFVFIGRNSGLSILCHECGFDYQQRVLKTFSSPSYLHSGDGVVRLLPFTAKCVYICR